LDGMVKMKVPAGTQPGAVLVLRGKGVRHVQRENTRGNQYVTMKVKIPTSITDREKELVVELGNIESSKANSTTSGEKMAYSVSSAWNRLKSFVSDTASAASEASKTKGSSGKKAAEEKS